MCIFISRQFSPVLSLPRVSVGAARFPRRCGCSPEPHSRDSLLPAPCHGGCPKIPLPNIPKTFLERSAARIRGSPAGWALPMLLCRRHFLCITSLPCALSLFVFPEPPFPSPGGSCEFREDLGVVAAQRGAFCSPQVEDDELQISPG